MTPITRLYMIRVLTTRDFNMRVGFETIGNATIIAYDHKPILVTDPWISGSAYYGSWILSHEIPPAQMQAIKAVQYVWLSHGHPDHLSSESLQLLKNKKILLPDHVGQRIYKDLKGEGYDVQIMPERKWLKLSDKIKVFCLSDYNQDAVLLLDINGRLVVDMNDAFDHGWFGLVKKIIKQYEKTFLLLLSGFGDADMINFFDEGGTRIPPLAAKKFPAGKEIALKTHALGCKYFIPFSSLHKYQRHDSVWTQAYKTGLSDYAVGFKSSTSQILSAFIQWDCETDLMTEIHPNEVPDLVIDSKVFGDDWDELPDETDMKMATTYFQSIEHLSTFLDYINLRVGKKDHYISLSKSGFKRGLTFEAPRNSLMNAIRYEVFDDMLIGNYMKTTLHGKWTEDRLYPDFAPYVTKYSDNARVKTRDELQHYFDKYKEREKFGYLFHQFDQWSKNIIRSTIPKESRLYQWVKKGYWYVKRQSVV